MILETNLIIFLIFVTFLGSTVKTTTGFGFALISVPLLLPFMDLPNIVAIILPLVLINDYAITITHKNTLKPKTIALMATSAIVSIPIGIFTLYVISTYILKLIISALILIIAFFLMSGRTITIKREKIATIIAGSLSGILASSSGLSGPPVTLLLINQKWNKVDFRSNLALYLSIIDSATVFFFLLTGLVNAESLYVDLLLIPSVIGGYLFGRILVKHISQYIFTKVTITIIIGGATFTIINTLMTHI
ncbi:MAG: sulfite exporter TauE/SafE family protein [SAR202 cluster bacterium]|nr:sulfite exporter TauE/SafE family protein [SAR202 cluster bacterium]|tara:strand:- start:5034 stop:5780 length:747 start_codon:yes stop_codon:yes gene_type:complete